MIVDEAGGRDRAGEGNSGARVTPDDQTRPAGVNAPVVSPEADMTTGSLTPGGDVSLVHEAAQAFFADVRALVDDHWSGCVPEREKAIEACPRVDREVYGGEDTDESPIFAKEPDWFVALVAERDTLLESEAEWQRRGDRAIAAEGRAATLEQALRQVRKAVARSNAQPRGGEYVMPSADWQRISDAKNFEALS